MDSRKLLKIASDFENLSAKAIPVKKIKFNVCPKCNAGSIVQCRCMRSDMTCANGHHWHYHGNDIHEGQSNHASKVCCNGMAIAMVEND